MNHEQALNFLQGRINFERFQAPPCPEREFKLDRMQSLLVRLGNPQDQLPIVHVAGTKGKGSTSAMLAAILTAAGYRTGLFTSPHIHHVEERIAIDGRPCSENDFASLIAAIRPVVEDLDREFTQQGEADHGPTYFEILTALAFLHFARSDVQAAVVEVGLGGRLDSTNVCRPRVAVITNISFDHTQQLGETLAAIAREKAGIIKPGVPVVSGSTEEEPRQVIEQIARNLGGPLWQLGRDFHYEYQPPRHLERQSTPGKMTFRLETPENAIEYRDLPLKLLGGHQAANAAVALAAICRLTRQGWTVSESSIRRGLAEIEWPARIEIVARHPAVVLDSAHNVASIAALMSVLKESFEVARRRLIFAATKEKDFRGMLEILLGQFDEVVFTQYTTNPRGVPPVELEATAFSLTGRHYPIYQTPANAWKMVHKSASPDDLICITGSFFIAGEMRGIVVSG